MQKVVLYYCPNCRAVLALPATAPILHDPWNCPVCQEAVFRPEPLPTDALKLPEQP